MRKLRKENISFYSSTDNAETFVLGNSRYARMLGEISQNVQTDIHGQYESALGKLAAFSSCTVYSSHVPHNKRTNSM
jgi:hypothetical protein